MQGVLIVGSRAAVRESLGLLLRWKDGTFCIEHGLESEDSSIEMDTMMVVMEGLRMADESTLSESPRSE